ncbi:MAG: chorismate synthase [Ignavibacteriales bacterium]|nr:MAG: chorismate synthase [Ignavibacteriales bacterium]
MIRFLTAGESHGKALTTIVEGFPSNIEIKEEYLNFHLKRRQMGYGRGLRMKIETDTAEILSGVRFQKTLGSPISMLIRNSDWENWTEKMTSGEKTSEVEKITLPRPGHADLVGVTKYNFDDIRNSIERSSARETAARVAACSIARRFLEEFGISIGSFVESVGGIYPNENYLQKLFNNELPENFNAWDLSLESDKSEVKVFEKEQEELIIEKIKEAKKKGDTLGGNFVVVATGVPVGLGSFVHYDRKLDAEIAHSIMSINAVKAVEVGTGFKVADIFGSVSHDEIIKKGENITRKTNRAGGIEGGVSTGLPIIVRGAMKPIATLMSPIESVDLATMEQITSRRERSDFMAVPACAVIAESMLAWSLAKYFLEKFGGDSLEETKDNFNLYQDKLSGRLRKNFGKV